MHRKNWIIYLIFVVGLTACNSPAALTPAVLETITSEVSEQATVQPTETPEPMAARVNGFVISLEDYQSELARYELALDGTPQSDAEAPSSQIVIQSMIEDVLLTQGAEENGYQPDPEILQQKLDEIINRIGGNTVFDGWMQKFGYNMDSFKKALEISIASAWMRDQIVSEVPNEAEQVHALQILVLSEPEAQGVLQQVRTGADFATLAEQYDPITKGDLGWFPRGYLLQPAVEEAAFSLQPGGASDVITTASGYHIIQVVGREADHPLSADTYAALQRLALKNWIKTRKENSQIEIFIQ